MKKILKYTAFAAMVGLFSSCSDSFLRLNLVISLLVIRWMKLIRWQV